MIYPTNAFETNEKLQLKLLYISILESKGKSALFMVR
jgi:hypothetical protein